jgi:hypothetical protein
MGRPMQAPSPFEIFSGFESTRIVCQDRPQVDALELTRHLEYAEEDLRLVRDAGLRSLRYSAPWHRIQPAEDAWDWAWMDRSMACLRSLGIDPILDPLHHVSFPAWLTGGFLHPSFEDRYLAFCRRLAERYPWARRYTIVNEPLVTSWLCGQEGVWYPYEKSSRSFVRMAVATARAIARVKPALAGLLGGIELVHADSCEEHRAAHPAAHEKVEFMNHKRFLVLDLLTGRVDHRHPLHGYLRPHVRDAELAWFREHPTTIDELGLDYYPHSEWLWGEEGPIVPHPSPRGFAAVAEGYLARYAPGTIGAFSLAETNIRGTIRDRCTWLRLMLLECERFAGRCRESGARFLRAGWYPFIDSTDWDTQVCQPNGRVDPQGIYWLDEDRRVRHASELSDLFGRLARGEMAPADLPAYPFSPMTETYLAGFVPLLAADSAG